MTTRGKRRFGRGRVPGCECESNYTCGPCLRAAPPWHCTPSTVAEQAAIPPDPADVSRRASAAMAAYELSRAGTWQPTPAEAAFIDEVEEAGDRMAELMERGRLVPHQEA